MGDSTYNGWTNYPTWAVVLWFGSDQGTAQEVEQLARSWEENTREGGTLSDLADALAELAEELAPTPSAGLAADLAGYAFAQIDFHEIARSFAVDVLDSDNPGAEIDRRRRLYLDRTLAQLGEEATR